MSSVLDKLWVECLIPREYEYLHHGVTQLGLQRKFKLKSLQVIIVSGECPRVGSRHAVKGLSGSHDRVALTESLVRVSRR